MRLALIPPVGLEVHALRSDTHMALAHEPAMLSTNRTIQLKRASERGDFVMLDNGINEGAAATPQQMKTYGQLIGATEIVLPDVLDSHVRTANTVKSFIDREEGVWGKFQSRMAVVQGTNKIAALTCLEKYVTIPEITTVGIPRRIIDNFVALNARIDLVNEIHRLFPGRFEIHLLGAHPMWPKEIKYAQQYTVARSMDTSLPFNWTIAGKKIDEQGEGYARPTGYFTSVKEVSMSLLDHNINTALEWARGTSTPAGSV